MGRAMLKGGVMFIQYFLLFIGSVTLATILVYLMLYGGLGIAKSLVYYDARVQAEAVSGLISAAASHSGDFRIVYTLPTRDCVLEITGDRVKISFSEKALQETGKIIKMAKSESEIFVIKPNYVTLKPSKISCDVNAKKTIAIQKFGNEIGVVS